MPRESFKNWIKALKETGFFLPYSEWRDQFDDEESNFEVRNDKPFIIELM